MKQRFEGKLASMIVERMSALNLTSRELADRTSISYEHIRKLTRGLAYPSAKAIDALSKALKLSRGELERSAIADRLQLKYKDEPEKLRDVFEKDPELIPLERVWKALTKEQKTSVITFARMLADQNARKRKKH